MPSRALEALRRSPHDKVILALAVPALGALAADPLVSLVDTAFVGRLGASSLGALAIASAVFAVAFSVFNFLAYGTTPLVSRAWGAGRKEDAGRLAFDALVVGLLLGLVSAAVLAIAAKPILQGLGAADGVLTEALTYLRIRLLALPAVLLITVGHGVFRGFQDTRTPLIVTIGLNVVNLVFDPVLIFGFDLGIAGAAWATVLAQWVGALWFLALLLGFRRHALGIRWRLPSRTSLRPLLGAGRALVLRTASLLAAITLATAVAARLGTVAVAAHQVAIQLWIFLALVVDALAIAAQAMVANELDRDPAKTRQIAERLLGMGLLVGLALAVVMAIAAPWLPGVFTDDALVVAGVSSVYPFIIGMQPLNAVVFVWDGIVIGATRFAFLAGSTLAAAMGAAVILVAVKPLGWGLPGVWWAMVALMAIRALSLVWWHLNGPWSSRSARPRASRGA